MVVGFEETDETKENVARDAEEYPAHINLSLYSVLKAHSTCVCSSDYSLQRHPVRLRLRDDIVKLDECVAFDILLSSSPSTWEYWQDLQLRVSM